jgi:hypothetical protein
MSRFGNEDNILGNITVEERLKRVEERFDFFENRLDIFFVKGRLRNNINPAGRPAPISSTDVQPPDKLYDIVRDKNYEYILIDNGDGTLQWRRISMESF